MASHIVRNQIVVTRGSLKDNEARLINAVTCIGDREFVEISYADRRFISFVGCDGLSPFAEEFLANLQTLRNDKVNDMIDAVLNGDEASKGIKRRKIDVFDEVAKVIELDVPQVDGCDVAQLTVLATPRENQKLSVELTSESLDYLRVGARSFVGSQTQQHNRRTGANRVRAEGCPNVFWNEQRRSWWIKYKDADDRWRTQHFTPRRSDAVETQDRSIEEAAVQAQTRYNAMMGESQSACSAGGDQSE